MAGKLCTGQPENNIGAARISQSKAYCEAIDYRSGDTALNRPITDNPHPSGSPDADAWDRGWTVADNAAGGAVPKDVAGCCAVGAGVVPV